MSAPQDSENQAAAARGIQQRQRPRRKKLLIRGVVLIAFLALYSQLSERGHLPPPLYFADLLCLNRCGNHQAAGVSHIRPPDNQLLNSDKKIFQALGDVQPDQNKISILIEKSRYKLTVYYDKKPIKSYPVALGENPVDDKLKEGDKSTPEGIFKIRDIFPHPDWSKFIWLDYPTKDSWHKHINAKIEGKIHWLDSAGSEIGIHGVPIGTDSLIDERSNWTWGCISLKNKDINELYQVVRKGTEVEIVH